MDVIREENGKTSITQNYYIISEKISLEKFIRVTRANLNIECGLHWRLDVIFDEAHSTNKKENSIENISTIRKIVYNLVRLDNAMGNLTLKKKMTRYNSNFKNIENLIFSEIVYF